MSWRRWMAMLQEAPEAGTLELIAREVRGTECGDEQLAGIRVERVSLGGTLGTVVDRGVVKRVLVERDLEPVLAQFVAAHEVGHLLLGEARPLLRDALSLAAEEALCDQFAFAVTGLTHAELEDTVLHR